MKTNEETIEDAKAKAMKAAKKEEKKAKMEVSSIEADKAKAMSAAKKEMAKAR